MSAKLIITTTQIERGKLQWMKLASTSAACQRTLKGCKVQAEEQSALKEHRSCRYDDGTFGEIQSQRNY